MLLKNRLFWIAALVGLVLDQLSKQWVMQNFNLQDTRPLLPGVFHLTYVTNTGAAFSLLTGKAQWLRWLSLAVSLGLMALAWFGPSLSRWEQLGYGLILGGALGNGIDRFFDGRVVDFLDFRLIQFPVFNLADVFINLGIFCLLLASLSGGSGGSGGSRGSRGSRGSGGSGGSRGSKPMNTIHALLNLDALQIRLAHSKRLDVEQIRPDINRGQ